EELADRQRALALHTREVHDSADRHERGRRVRRMRRDALLPHLRDVADVAVLLEAEAQRLTPEVRLIVVRAARVEAEIAPDRAHVAELRPRDEACGACERGRVLADERMPR